MKSSIKHKETVVEILKNEGALLGSELSQIIIEKLNVSATYSRQIIHRLKNNREILNTEPVRFQKNQVLYFLPGQNIKKKLREVMPDHAKTIERVYQALVELDGFLFWSEFAKVSAGVVNQEQSSKKSAMSIYKDMKNLGMVNELYDFHGLPVVIANKNWIPDVEVNAFSLMKREQQLSFTRKFTADLLQWLERLNFVGWNSTRLTGNDEFEKGYNGFYWDAIGYSYLWGLYRTNKKDGLYNPAEEKAGSLVVIESIIHRKTKRHDINGFINRVDNIYGPVKKDKYFKIIPVCFVDSIEDEALILARKRGILVIRLVEVFGTKIVESLKQLRDIDPRNIDVEMLAKILKNADDSGQDGKFGTLKGYVFNFLVAYIFSQFQFTPKVGVKYQDPDLITRKCECDIIAPVDDEWMIVCEVKGYSTGNEVMLGETENDSDSVKKFFEKTCDIASKSTRRDIIPLFITSSSFSSEAIEYMEKRISKKLKSKLKSMNFPSKVFYDRNDLMDLFGNDSKYTELKKILKEFFKEQKQITKPEKHLNGQRVI